MSTRQSVVVVFALLDLRHELMEDFFASIQNATDNLAKDKLTPKAVHSGIRDVSNYVHSIKGVISDLDEVLNKHPVYIPGSIARLALKPIMDRKAVYSQYAAARWSKDSKVSELNFLVSLLSLLTGPRTAWFEASSLKIDHSVVLKEAFRCVVDYEEEYGPDISSNFFHQCLIHFKTVKSSDFHNTL